MPTFHTHTILSHPGERGGEHCIATEIKGVHFMGSILEIKLLSDFVMKGQVIVLVLLQISMFYTFLFSSKTHLEWPVQKPL